MEFVGTWLQLPPNIQTQLGQGSQSERLGFSAVAGERVWDCQSQFRIILGPMGMNQYADFLPNPGESLERLVAIVRNYVGDELGWDVNLILKQAEIPELILGEGAQLGWTSWLGEAPDRDADDLCLSPFSDDL